MVRLPPFAALRAFDAVARAGSFTVAAAHLGVTQAAVSRQIKRLEDHLGLTLINRMPGGNDLTPPGKLLAQGVRRGLMEMEDAVAEISAATGRMAVTVSVAPFFSSHWLTPRLTDFIALNPHIEIRLHHAYQPPDYRRDQIDLGVNWSDGTAPGIESETFIDGSLTAVCSPTLATALDPGAGPAGLLAQPLFCEFDTADWTAWFHAAGVDAPDPGAVTRLDDSHALRRVALEGHGIALFFRSFLDDDLRGGRLVQPFDVTVDTGFHYFVTYPSRHGLSAAAKRFRRWLFEARPNA